jgi:TPR repeat protein
LIGLYKGAVNMMFALGDAESGRVSGDLVIEFKRAIESSIRDYFKTEQIDWGAVTAALMAVSAETNDIADLDYDLAIMAFTTYMNNRQRVTEKDGRDSQLVAAAKSGSVDAQLKLGLMYKAGKNVVQDLGEAIRWFQMAANNESSVAQNELGVL